MQERHKPTGELRRSDLKPPENAIFPQCVQVRTDRPGGLVAYHDGVVGFENTNLIIRISSAWKDAFAPEEEMPHVGPLSLIFAGGGQDVHEIDGRRLVIDDHSYLIHNLGQSVNSLWESSTCVESFTVGFWPGFAESVLHGMATPADQLLDSPKPRHGQPVRFFDQVYSENILISPLLARVRAAVANPTVTKGMLEELHFDLLEAMLLVHREIGAQIAKLPAERAATRTELYRRLHQARDFIDASLDRPISLPEIATEACISPYYLLRQFKQVFAETPHQYLTRRRLERAQSLLLRTEMPVTDIRSAVGFESLGSFSHLFRQRMGMSPQQFRRHHGVDAGTAEVGRAA